MVVQGCANCHELRRQLAIVEEELDEARTLIDSLVVQRREDLEKFTKLYSELGEDLVALKVQRDQDRAAFDTKVQALEARLDHKDREALLEQKLKEATATASLKLVNTREKKRFRSICMFTFTKHAT